MHLTHTHNWCAARVPAQALQPLVAAAGLAPPVPDSLLHHGAVMFAMRDAGCSHKVCRGARALLATARLSCGMSDPHIRRVQACACYTRKGMFQAERGLSVRTVSFHEEVVLFVGRARRSLRWSAGAAILQEHFSVCSHARRSGTALLLLTVRGHMLVDAERSMLLAARAQACRG